MAQQEKTLSVKIPAKLDKRIELAAISQGVRKRDIVIAALGRIEDVRLVYGKRK